MRDDGRVRRGAPGDSMFFLVSGDVVVESDSGDIALKEGDFFGEMALLEQRAAATHGGEMDHQENITDIEKKRNRES